MTDHQRAQLLDALMHYMPMDVRQKIAAELPEAYAAWWRVRRAAGELALAEHDRLRAASSAAAGR